MKILPKRKSIIRMSKKPKKPDVLNLLSLFPDYRKTSYKEKVAARTAESMGELCEAYLHIGLVLYVGAGVSRSIGLPSWADLIRSLTVAMMTRKVETALQALGKLKEEKYWQAISQIQEDVEKTAVYDKPILMMARAIKDELKQDLPRVITRTFYRHLARAIYLTQRKNGSFVRMEKLPDSELIKELVSLSRAQRDIKGVQAIVNYNYDDTLDESLRQNNVRCLTVRSGKDRVPQGALPCYHVHGILPLSQYLNPRRHTRAVNYGNFVFSEDEYHAEYSDPYRWSNRTQMSLLGRYTGLFVGLSLEDPNIRRLLDVTHRQYPENLNYAILPRKRPFSGSKDTKDFVLRNLYEEVETSSFEKIGVRIIWVDSHDEVPCLLHEICTGEKIRPNKGRR
jgi:hypothetical protein